MIPYFYGNAKKSATTATSAMGAVFRGFRGATKVQPLQLRLVLWAATKLMDRIFALYIPKKYFTIQRKFINL